MRLPNNGRLKIELILVILSVAALQAKARMSKKEAEFLAVGVGCSVVACLAIVCACLWCKSVRSRAAAAPLSPQPVQALLRNEKKLTLNYGASGRASLSSGQRVGSSSNRFMDVSSNSAELKPDESIVEVNEAESPEAASVSSERLRKMGGARVLPRW